MTTKEDGRPITDAEVTGWRTEFPMLSERIHVANCSHGPQSRRVRRAVEAYLASWRAAGMDWDRWLDEVEAARREFAALIGARPEEVAISTSASAAVASIASGLEIEPTRSRVVTTEAEFPTVGHVWLAHRRYGLEVEFLPLRDGEIPVEEYERHVDERTRLVSATHVYYRTGFRQDLSRIAEIAHSAGALLLVDAYQSLGTLALDVREQGIDMLVGGALKYLLGLPGIAFLYVRDELIDRFRPALTGWLGQADPFAFDPTTLQYADDARRFETGTPPIFAAAAARAGISIINEVGVDRVEGRIHRLSAHAISAARDRGLDYVGPLDPARKGALNAIRVPRPAAMEAALRERGIIATARGDVVRVAPHFFTTLQEIERVMDEIRERLEADG